MQPKTATSDSLAFYFQEANIDTLPYQKRYSYAQKALAIVSKQPNDSMYRVNMFKVANRFWNMDAYEDYKKTVFELIKESKTATDTVCLAKTYIYMADYYGKKYNPDSTYIFYSKAEKIYRKLRDSNNLAKSLLNQAFIQYNENDFLGSERNCFEALKVLKFINSSEMMYEAYNQLGLIFCELAEYELSKKYFDKALSKIENNEISKKQHLGAIVLNNTGLLYQKQKKYQEAIRLYTVAIRDDRLLRDRPNIYAVIANNLAYSKLKFKDFQHLPENVL